MQLKSWIAPNPAPQFIALAVVFFLGFQLNGTLQGNPLSQQNNPSENYLALQQEGKSLTSLVAISMLQKPQASERLTGVAYSKQTGLIDPKLNQLLIERLKNDSSTAVKLAIVNALNQSDSVIQNQSVLTELAIMESNPLVQMALFKLLFENASNADAHAFLEKMNATDIHPDVKAFIEQLQTQFKA